MIKERIINLLSWEGGRKTLAYIFELHTITSLAMCSKKINFRDLWRNENKENTALDEDEANGNRYWKCNQGQIVVWQGSKSSDMWPAPYIPLVLLFSFYKI